MSKYGAIKTTIDGIKFASRAEGAYYSRLKIQKRAKQINEFELQPVFVLVKPFRKNGKHFRGIKYVADFRVTHLDGSIEIVDVKGSKETLTQVYKIKKQLFENLFPDLTITEVYA